MKKVWIILVVALLALIAPSIAQAAPAPVMQFTLRGGGNYTWINWGKNSSLATEAVVSWVQADTQGYHQYKVTIPKDTIVSYPWGRGGFIYSFEVTISNTVQPYGFRTIYHRDFLLTIYGTAAMIKFSRPVVIAELINKKWVPLLILNDVINGMPCGKDYYLKPIEIK